MNETRAQQNRQNREEKGIGKKRKRTWNMYKYNTTSHYIGPLEQVPVNYNRSKNS